MPGKTSRVSSFTDDGSLARQVRIELPELLKRLAAMRDELLEHRGIEPVRMLIEVREALVRMGEGTYGQCEACERVIEIERLRRVPYARLCIPCQVEENRSSSRA